MIVKEEELFKIRKVYRDEFKNKVYHVPNKANYGGDAFVYASSVYEANILIEKYKEEDNNNLFDSWGYNLVDEKCYTGELTDESTQIIQGIYYVG